MLEYHAGRRMDLRAKKDLRLINNRKPEREVRTVSAVTNPIYQLNSVERRN